MSTTPPASSSTAAPPPPHTGIRFNLCSTSTPDNSAPILDFIPDIAAFLAKQQLASPDPVLEELNRLHKNLKTHQQRLADEKADAETRIPDLEENVRLLSFIRQRRDKPVSTRFLAADGVWADALLDNDDKVCLWLGANVMMQYTFDEATTILENSLSTLRATLDSKTDSLAHVKEQLTLCEVTISRFYNHGVALRRAAAQHDKKAG